MGKKKIADKRVWVRDRGEWGYKGVYVDIGARLPDTLNSEIPAYMPLGDAQLWQANEGRGKERK